MRVEEKIIIRNNKEIINGNLHPETIKVYSQMLEENYLIDEKLIYKFNKKTGYFEKFNPNPDYCI